MSEADVEISGLLEPHFNDGRITVTKPILGRSMDLGLDVSTGGDGPASDCPPRRAVFCVLRHAVECDCRASSMADRT